MVSESHVERRNYRRIEFNAWSFWIIPNCTSSSDNKYCNCQQKRVDPKSGKDCIVEVAQTVTIMTLHASKDVISIDHEVRRAYQEDHADGRSDPKCEHQEAHNQGTDNYLPGLSDEFSSDAT